MHGDRQIGTRQIKCAGRIPTGLCQKCNRVDCASLISHILCESETDEFSREICWNSSDMNPGKLRRTGQTGINYSFRNVVISDFISKADGSLHSILLLLWFDSRCNHVFTCWYFVLLINQIVWLRVVILELSFDIDVDTHF